MGILKIIIRKVFRRPRYYIYNNEAYKQISTENPKKLTILLSEYNLFQETKYYILIDERKTRNNCYVNLVIGRAKESYKMNQKNDLDLEISDYDRVNMMCMLCNKLKK